MIRNIPGNVPEPGELHGRSSLLDNLWRAIASNNILLLAPRRFGKTGVMRHILKQPRPGYLPVYFDLEDVDSPHEFVWRVAREVLAQDRLRSLLRSARGLPGAIKEWARDTFDEIEFDGARVKFRADIAADWRNAARRLLLELEKAGPTLVFIFDELPAMLDKVHHASGDDEARSFMAWFRSVRMQQQDELRRHRFLVGGSTGLDLILRRLSALDTLNDFARISVLSAIAGAPSERVGATALYETYRRARGRSANEREFDELLADLECDWYVVLDHTTNEYHFLLSVMRDWWRRWHGARRRRPHQGTE